jgi:Protein of unknown function (DUF3485)
MKWHVQEWFVLALTALVLVGAGVQRMRLSPSPNAPLYHLEVARSLASIPTQTHTLRSSEAPIPRAATELLKPNATFSRTYVDLANSANFGLFVVHCGDGRDMFAHYPPICYGLNGYKELSRTEVSKSIDGIALRGFEYEFVPIRLDGGQHIRVFNVLLLADGLVCRDMPEMRRHVMSQNARTYGAAQVQITVSGSVDPVIRNRLFEQGLELAGPAIRSILADPAQLSNQPQ